MAADAPDASDAANPASASAPLPDQLQACRGYLEAYAVRAVGDRATASDLVQETLLAAVTGLGRLTEPARLRTWLIGILAHKIADHFRRRGREELFAPGERSAPELVETASRSPQRAAQRAEKRALVERALTALPELERMAVMLVDVEEVERAEACQALGVSAGHLRVLLHRGRHRMRRALEDDGILSSGT